MTMHLQMGIGALLIGASAALAASPMRAEYEALLARQSAMEAVTQYSESDPIVRRRLGLDQKLPTFEDWLAQRLSVPAPRSNASTPREIASRRASVAPPLSVHQSVDTVQSLGHREELVLDEPRGLASVDLVPAASATQALDVTARVQEAVTYAPTSSPAATSAAPNSWSFEPMPTILSAAYLTALATLSVYAERPGAGALVRVGRWLLMAPLWATLALIRAFFAGVTSGARSSTTAQFSSAAQSATTSGSRSTNPHVPPARMAVPDDGMLTLQFQMPGSNWQNSDRIFGPADSSSVYLKMKVLQRQRPTARVRVVNRDGRMVDML